jgi:hypothetical protein
MNENIPVIIGEAVAGQQAARANAVRKALSVLSEDIRASTFDMSILLYEVSANNYAAGWGFASVSEYAAKELGLKERKSQYLIRLVRVCNAVGVKRSDYEPVGVSKLREITSLDPYTSYFNPDIKQNESMSDHIVDLLSRAEDMTYDQVKQAVSVLKGEVGENARVWVPSFWVTKSCMENVILPARELVRKRLGSAPVKDEAGNAIEYSDGVAEELIHAEFLADLSNYEPEPDESKEQTDVANVDEDSDIPTGTDSPSI